MWYVKKALLQQIPKHETLTFIPTSILRGSMALQSQRSFFCGHPVDSFKASTHKIVDIYDLVLHGWQIYRSFWSCLIIEFWCKHLSWKLPLLSNWRTLLRGWSWWASRELKERFKRASRERRESAREHKRVKESKRAFFRGVQQVFWESCFLEPKYLIISQYCFSKNFKRFKLKKII